MTPTEVEIMDELIPAAKAEEDLRDRWDTLTAEGVRARVLLATGGDHDEASLASARRAIQLDAIKQAKGE